MNFSIGLFQIGDPKACLYSWFCLPCAIADSRTALDGSSFCFNLCWMNWAAFRWIARSAYQIGDPSHCWEDILATTFCPCCTVNQLYQTTQRRGNPTVDGGAAFNTMKMKPINIWPPNKKQFAYNLFCRSCSQADLLHRVFGMPWLLGFSCVNLPFFHNLIRYQYRLATANGRAEWIEEYILPSFFYGFVWTQLSQSEFSFLKYCCLWTAEGIILNRIQDEVESQQPSTAATRHYLSPLITNECGDNNNPLSTVLETEGSLSKSEINVVRQRPRQL